MSTFSRIGLVIGILVVLGVVWFVKSLQADLAEARKNEIIYAEAAEAAEFAAKHLENSIERDAQIIEDKLIKEAKLTTEVKSLERKLRGALNNAKNTQITLDSPLPRDAALALCMQWQNANGYKTNNNGTNTTKTANDGATHTPTAHVENCENWQGLSIKNVIEWSGLLLEHAGKERLDKAALRAWVDEVEKQ